MNVIDNNVFVMTYTDHLLFGLLEFFRWAEIFIVLAVALIVADLIFGIKAARTRKETVKRSRALRRTFGKMSDYFIWIILAYLLGQGFGKPYDVEIIPSVVLLVVCAAELESVFVNFFESRGKHVKVKLFKGFFNKNKDIIDIDDE